MKMYCGPIAIADIVGWTQEQAWLHIRALREAGLGDRKRMTDQPHSGTSEREILDVARKAGWIVAEQTPKAMSFANFIRLHGRRGKWLCIQSKHMFSYNHGRTKYHSGQGGVRILRAYRLIRAPAEEVTT